MDKHWRSILNGYFVSNKLFHTNRPQFQILLPTEESLYWESRLNLLGRACQVDECLTSFAHGAGRSNA